MHTPDQLTLAFPIIERQAENALIPQRAYDGYVNATAMCQACGKYFNHYISNATAQAFIAELVSDTGIPVSELIQIVKGGVPQLQGTWVHPQIAINLGQWASPKFAVLVSKWVFEWMSGNVKTASVLPYHIQRYLINRERIPPTHFSMLDQMTLKLLAPLETRGYIIPQKLMPDISLGKMFSQWLRNNGYNPDSFPTYEHVFNDGVRYPVKARLYPNELLTSFNLEVNRWIRNNALKYFGERDKNAVLPLEQIILALPAPPQSTELDNKLMIALNKPT